MHLLPHDEDSLADVVAHARLLTRALPHFEALVAGGTGDGDANAHALAIRRLEDEGDRLLTRVNRALRDTFITPLDRDGLHNLTHRVDDVLDAIDAVAFRLACYTVHPLVDAGQALALSMRYAIESVTVAVSLLPDARRRGQLPELIADLGRLEKAADDQLCSALRALFAVERDAATLVQHKDIYELCEAVTNRCWNVAEALEDLLLDA